MGFSLLQGIILFASAFAAGMINSIAGGGTLLTFPTLIWLGLDAKEANATSTVALRPGLVGGPVGFARRPAPPSPPPHLARTRRERGERDEHRRALAGTRRRPVRLPARTGKEP